MFPDKELGLTPMVGLEVEIVNWKERHRKQVVRDLLEYNYMDPNGNFDQDHHTYHCKCNVCKRWVRADASPYPVQWSLSYDGTLPLTGGEFISSPFPVNLAFLESVEHSFEIMTHDAEWTMKLKNKNGGPSSPSIHIHASCDRLEKEQISLDDNKTIQRALYYFRPEFFAMADACSYRRGLLYRLPQLHGHHSMVNLIRQGKRTHLEWRMFEAAYDDWEYVHGAIHFCAAMTQVLAHPVLRKKLGGLSMIDKRKFQWNLGFEPKTEDELDITVDHIISFAGQSYFDIIEKMVTNYTYLKYSEEDRESVVNLINRGRSHV